MASDEIELLKERNKIVRTLIQDFEPERKYYRILTILAFFVLLCFIVYFFIQGTLTYPQIAILFGPTGLIAFCIGRLFAMFDKALTNIFPSDKN